MVFKYKMFLQKGTLIMTKMNHKIFVKIRILQFLKIKKISKKNDHTYGTYSTAFSFLLTIFIILH